MYFGRTIKDTQHSLSLNRVCQTTAVSGLNTVVTAIGTGIAIWGVINLLEGYGNDNLGAKSQEVKEV